MSRAQCPVCGSSDTVTLVSMDAVPVFCNVLHDSAERARSAARAPFELRFCSACTHGFNGVFDPSLVEYSGAYENALHFSPTFGRYASALADRLVTENELRGRTVVEIGSGDGSFLERICMLGGNRGIGFDPSHATGRSGPVMYVSDRFSERYSHTRPDFVCCRHVLEHIATPRAFVDAVRRTLDTGAGCGAYFEVPNALYTLRDLGIWDLIYEHCGYFSPLSLRVLFESAGYRVVRLAEAYGGQFLGLEAKAEAASPPPQRVSVSAGAPRGRLARAGGAAYGERVAHWRRRLRQIADEGRGAAVWGAGSKGVTFLNVADPEGLVRWVVDINPRKHGKYVAGTGQQVIAPADIGPDTAGVVLLMNPLYYDEVSGMLHERGIRCPVETVT